MLVSVIFPRECRWSGVGLNHEQFGDGADPGGGHRGGARWFQCRVRPLSDAEEFAARGPTAALLRLSNTAAALLAGTIAREAHRSHRSFPHPGRHPDEHRCRRPTAQAPRRCRDRPRTDVENEDRQPHLLRHTAAMRLLHAGIDTTVIALWLGHESPETTLIYFHADLALKERALERVRPTGIQPGRYAPGDKLMAFLEAL
ncbi:tyrosine-type recombinase/integrase [Cryobacterium glaciale]|nr:tyrosine-type recombinase/integrase [Cryobacterium glaciale]